MPPKLKKILKANKECIGGAEEIQKLHDDKKLEKLKTLKEVMVDVRLVVI